MGDYVSLKISISLNERLQRVVDSSSGAFSGVEDYVAFVLGETLKELEGTREVAPQDKKLIEDRLKKLGYSREL